MRAVLVGDDFRFGHKQAGDTCYLTTLGQHFGFEVECSSAGLCARRACQQ